MRILTLNRLCWKSLILSMNEKDYLFKSTASLPQHNMTGEKDRGNWNNQCEFILTCVGLAVGLGNVWRFPYLCYKNGGGAFLIPYFLSMLFLGIPLFYLELILGQYGGLGPIKIWRASPAFKGLGVAMTMTSFIISLYYNVVVAYCFYYFFSSMAAQLPWTTCDKTWNTCYCRDGNQNESLADPWAGTRPECVNFTYSKNLTSPYEEYFNIRVLGLTSGLGEAGNVKWDLCLCLLLAWLVVFLVLSKGVQSLGKVVYFSALFPYFLLTALLIRGVTLEGYYEGIYYYITPDFSKLKEASVWSDAAVQIFFSLSTCQGSLVALGSYNKFNNNVLRDTFLVPIINCLTSFYAGFSIFAVLGFMAHKKNVDVQDVATDGPGLTFLVYPEGLAQMPIAPLWSILFFFMMLTLGFSSQFSIVETVLTGIQDTYVSKFKSTRWTVVFRFAVCMTGFLLGLPMVTEGGHYLFTIVDNFIGGFPVLFIGLFEIIVIMYVYGFRKFKRDIESMIGINIAVRISHYFFVPLWLCFSPVMLLVIIFVKAYQFNGLKLDDYVFPNWGLTIGWFIVIGALIWIPLFFVLRAIQHGLCKFCKEMNSPKPSWKPNVKDGDTFYGDIFPSVENNAEKQFSHTDFNAGVSQNVIENGKSQHQYDNSAFDGQRM